MLDKLPLEIQLQIFKLAPRSQLKQVNTHFYTLYNEQYNRKIISQFGLAIVDVIIKVLPWLRKYIKSLDVFRRVSREIISKRLQLVEANDSSQFFQVKYIADSWRYIHSLLQNKRLFAEYEDYTIDEPVNYVYNHYVEINRTYLLSYKKDIWLTPGFYNLRIGLVVKHGSGLGTTKFEVRCGESKYTFYPPTNINEILPKHQFCMLKIGDFYVQKLNGNKTESNLQKVRLIMEEIGLYLKSGFRIYFIDVSQPSVLFNDYELLYYTMKESNYKYFINLPLKNFYKALNQIQENNGNGNPYILKYDYEYPLDGFDGERVRPRQDQDESDLDTTELSGDSRTEKELKEPQDSQDLQLMQYSDYFYNKTNYRKMLKFLTIYQKRQFINRFGDFESPSNSASVAGYTYDVDGLIWKMPLLSDI